MTSTTKVLATVLAAGAGLLLTTAPASGAAGAAIVDRQLRVLGGGGADVIRILRTGANDVAIDDGADGTFEQRFDRSQFDTILLDGRGGGDRLRIDPVNGDPSAGKAVEIVGGPGEDTITGGPGADVVRGGPGADEIRGAGGADVLRGDENGDFFRWAPGDGDDVVDGGGVDPDTFVLTGTEGDDVLNASVVSGVLQVRVGGDGGRMNLAGVERLHLHLGGGHDGVFPSADLAATTDLEEIDVVAGPSPTPGAIDDVLRGSDTRDRLQGGPGRDHILGGGGDDVVDGGADADILGGGAGADVFDCGDAPGDTLEDLSADDLTVDCGAVVPPAPREPEPPAAPQQPGGTPPLPDGRAPLPDVPAPELPPAQPVSSGGATVARTRVRLAGLRATTSGLRLALVPADGAVTVRVAVTERVAGRTFRYAVVTRRVARRGSVAVQAPAALRRLLARRPQVTRSARVTLTDVASGTRVTGSARFVPGRKRAVGRR